MCLGNIAKYFTINNMKKGLKWSAKDFSADFNPNLIDTNDILGIHKYLMKKT